MCPPKIHMNSSPQRLLSGVTSFCMPQTQTYKYTSLKSGFSLHKQFSKLLAHVASIWYNSLHTFLAVKIFSQIFLCARLIHKVGKRIAHLSLGKAQKRSRPSKTLHFHSWGKSLAMQHTCLSSVLHTQQGPDDTKVTRVEPITDHRGLSSQLLHYRYPGKPIINGFLVTKAKTRFT